MAGVISRSKQSTKPSSFSKIDHYIKEVLAELPSKKPLKSYANILLKSLNLRVLQRRSHTELADFVQARFSFFQDALTQRGGFQILNQSMSNKTQLELVQPDAAHLYITLQSLFNEFDIQVTFKIQFMVTVELNQKQAITTVTHPTEKSERVSIIYVEFNEIEDESLLKELNQRVKIHLNAVKLAQKDNKDIIDKMMSLKKTISKRSVQLSIPKEEWIHLLDWLSNLNFSFFGYSAFKMDSKKNSEILKPMTNHGLGIVSKEALDHDLTNMTDNLAAYVWKFRNSSNPFRFEPIKVKSPIKRFENLMCLSLKIPNNKGQIVNHIFLGLIKRSSLFAKNSEVPIIHYKMNYIFEKKNFFFDSFDYNQVVRFFSEIPQYELFRSPLDNLLEMIENLLSITNPHKVHCFSKSNIDQKSVQLLITIPPQWFTSHSVKTVVDYLKNDAPYTDYEFVEVKGYSTCRLHVYFDLAGDGKWKPDTLQIEKDISERIKTWEERVRQALYEQYPSVLSEQICNHYLPLMPPHYCVRNSPSDVVRDMMVLERMEHGSGFEFDLTSFQIPGSDFTNKASLLYVYSRHKIDLIHILPILQNMGFYVIDQLTARIGNDEKTVGFIQSFRIQNQKGDPLDDQYKTIIKEILTAIFEERTENDPLNALTILSGLGWREVNVLQLYRNLFLQVGSPYTRERINTALVNYPHHAGLLFKYFETRFSPANQFGDLDYRIQVLLPEMKLSFIDSLDEVAEVSDDVILRRLFNLMENTLRTNFYIPKQNKDTFISIKLDSRNVDEMPVPTPFREIYIHDVGMEGTHLRFGTVARGGLRWSDRLDDFRTEVLGLVKTQQTKNVVIVPVGSKGGFVVKKAQTTPEDAAHESQKQYKKFISGLLDITDNMDAHRQAQHPSNMLIYDELDSYLVVAADKGTATFSDMANAISTSYQFWLDDAFASGGSVGYDHKKEGITARGAWECVKLHFQEKGKDIQTEPFTVAGIGDMSGDVFGNGMLLSKVIRLQAAFNHIHIFIDPDPDTAKSWEERNRLFHLPRSTWEDYSTKLISTGGGLFNRKAKRITLSPEMKTLLNVEEDVLNGEEVVKAILKIEVELLWFGGIGTYLKADNETHFQVGDQANDGVRIDISDCHASVIGEGANLGLTQLGRIQFDQKGQLNTDAIDNSAGVNMSDYEVNIKILLQQMLQQKHLKSTKDRNETLALATDEVSELVLVNNRGQHRLISMDIIRSDNQFRIFKNLIRFMITEKGLDDRSESIPTRGTLEAMEKAGEHLARPILSVLQAYVKMWVYNSLLESKILSSPYLESTYIGYFPETIRKRFGKKISKHPLKSEIIGTLLTNKVINQAGITFMFRLEQLSGKSIADIVLAYLIFDESLKGHHFRESVLGANGVSEQEKYLALITFEDTIQMLVQNLLQHSSQELSFSMIEPYSKLLDTLRANLSQSHEEVQNIMKTWQEKGFSEEVASNIAVVSQLGIAPDVLYLHEEVKLGIAAALQLTVQVNNVFGFQWIKDKIQTVELPSDWEQSHQDILLQTIEVHKKSLIRFLLRFHDEKTLETISAESLLEPLNDQFTIPLSGYFQTLNQLKMGSPINLTSLSVGINGLSFLEVTQDH